MNLAGINDLVRDVFGPSYLGKVINGWMSIRCPIAQWTHERGKDSRESAGISINDTGTSVFNCFTCGNKMPVQGLLRKYAGFTGEDLDDLIEELEEEAYLGPRGLPSWDELKGGDPGDPVPLKESIYLDLYDSAAGHPYLRSRGISRKTAKKLQLMVDPSDPADGEERILFPVFGADGALYGFSGRATSDEARLKVRDYFGLKKAACVLGAHLITLERPDKVLLVEGLFDYANCWECGQPGVALMHSSFTDRQIAIVRSFSLPTYLFQDDDQAGDKGRFMAVPALINYVPVHEVTYPDVLIEDDNGGHYIKDPGELNEEEFREMILSARLIL